MTTDAVVSDKTWWESRSFLWKIPHFAEIRKVPELVKKQKTTFEMGSDIGLPTKWEASLGFSEDGQKKEQVKDEDERFIGAFVKLTDYPKDRTVVQTHVRFQLKSKAGSHKEYVADNEYNDNMVKYAKIRRGFGFDMFDQQHKRADLPLQTDGSVEMVLTVTIFNPEKMGHSTVTPVNLAKITVEYEAKFSSTFRSDVVKLRENPTEVVDRATKFVSKDGKEFPVNRVLLAARSPVFQGMFQANMTEEKSGVVNVEDMEGEPLKALLDFCHTGTLPENWKEEGVIEGLMYGAHKYLVDELKQFLGKVVALVCTNQNCCKLLSLALTLEMKEAETALFEYFTRHVVTDVDQMFQFVETIKKEQGEGEDFDDDGPGENKKSKIMANKEE